MIGFVLSDGIETNLYQTIQFYTLEELFLRPVFLVLIAICVLSILSGLKIIDKAVNNDLKKLKIKWRKQKCMTNPNFHRITLANKLIL